MTLALQATIKMTEMICGECGITFNIPETWRAEKQLTGASWYCPNGHCRVYKESDTERMRKQLEEEKRRHANTLSRLNEAIASELKVNKEITRIKKRAAAGVCPCCNRTFQQLARHMKTKHPNYK